MSVLEGIAASQGVGIGRAMLVEEPDLTYVSRTVDDVAAETDRFRAAVARYIEETRDQAAAVRSAVGDHEAEILEGHVAMISDPYMTGEMEKLIGQGICAEDALAQICDMFAGMFEASGDELTAQRATDVRDVKTGVLTCLLNKRRVDIATLPKGTVIVTHDLTPSMTADIRPGCIAAVVTETGGVTSHCAILARAMELPAVLSVPDATSLVSDGDELIVSGSDGTVTLEPTESDVVAARAQQEKLAVERAELSAFVGARTVTADGDAVKLFANIGTPADAVDALDHDAEGIGLFRTEFLFMDASAMPTEDEQFAAYKKVALTMKGKPVVIRTLDIGGDKDIPYMGFEHEDNPFLGFRAIRYCLAREDVFRAQLRALLRASAFGDIRIMLPLVTCYDEVTAVRELVRRYMHEFDREKIAYNPDVKIGVMIETPAAALVADLLSEVSDFFSIGTNDLTGYTMAADRGNERVRYLYSAYNPAVLRSIRQVIAAGTAGGIEVGMCGEAAADPLIVPLWIAFGLDEYSVTASSVLACRREISTWTRADACALADAVMGMRTADEVYQALRAAHEARQK
jgi:phosphotransferase system enzyme I (PtsI)